MTEAEWLAADDAKPMRAHLRGRRVSERKLRLFACGFFRLRWPAAGAGPERGAGEAVLALGDRRWLLRAGVVRRCALLRCVFGNAFRPAPALAPSVLAHKGGTAPKLAQAIYEERSFERLPVLADALEDAGCADPD